LAACEAAREKLDALCPPVHTCAPRPETHEEYRARRRAVVEAAWQRSQQVSAYIAAEKARWHARQQQTLAAWPPAITAI